MRSVASSSSSSSSSSSCLLSRPLLLSSWHAALGEVVGVVCVAAKWWYVVWALQTQLVSSPKPTVGDVGIGLDCYSMQPEGTSMSSSSSNSSDALGLVCSRPNCVAFSVWWVVVCQHGVVEMCVCVCGSVCVSLSSSLEEGRPLTPSCTRHTFPLTLLALTSSHTKKKKEEERACVCVCAPSRVPRTLVVFVILYINLVDLASCHTLS